MNDLVVQNFNQILSENHDVLMNSQQRLLELLYPYHLVDNSTIDKYISSNSKKDLQKFTFYRIVSCSVEQEENAHQILQEKMERLMTVIHSMQIPVVYGIISKDGFTSLVLGIYGDDQEKYIYSVISGLLSGIQLQSVQPSFSVKNISNRYYGMLPAIPALKINDVSQQFDISHLMRSLNGKEYIILFMARPLHENIIDKQINQLIDIRDACFAISKRNLSIQNSTTDMDTHSEGVSNSHTHSTSTTTGVSAGFGIGEFGGGVSVSHTTSDSYTKTTSKQDSVSHGITSGNTISGDIQNGQAMELMEYASFGLERLKSGRNTGIWQTAITFSSEDVMTRNIIQACLCGELSKPVPQLLPARAFQTVKQQSGELPVLIPKGILTEDILINPLCAILTSPELGFVCSLPTDSSPDFSLLYNKNLPMISDRDTSAVQIGKLADGERVIENMPFSLSEADLNKHTFVCGITGSGKTTTVKSILNNCNKPFMVIEPAKKEYRNLKLDNNSSKIVYTLGKPEINCLQINPFYITPGISPQTHIDYLKDLFNASFSFYGPMPYILEKCLQNIYEKRGWNLTLGYHPYLSSSHNIQDLFDHGNMQNKAEYTSHKYLYPTMHDLKCEIQRYVEEEMEYEGEVSGNIKTAIKARLESLCNGAKGFMFNTYEYADMDDLLTQNIIFELEGLADDSDKAFCVGLLIVYINEYRQVFKETSGNRKIGLQHLLVIEEAHRLLKNVDTERSSESMGNPKGKAVEHFTNMIAEMRSYGQGVIIAEQIPTKLAPDVLKNSSNKIVQRIVSVDDQTIVANTIGLQSKDSIYIGSLRTGYALCHKEGMSQPVKVKINPIEDTYVSDEMLYQKSLDDRMYRVHVNMVWNAVVDQIDTWMLRLLNTMFACKEKTCLIGIEKLHQDTEALLQRKGVRLISCQDEQKVYAAVYMNVLTTYLMNGIYNMNAIISDHLYKRMFDLLRLPTLEKLQNVKDRLFNIYQEDLHYLGVRAVTAMVLKQYVPNIDIKHMIENYFLLCDDMAMRDIIYKLQKKG